jgi:hypothetical protein
MPRSALLPELKEVGTYYNYLLPSLDNWQDRYWGANYARLQKIKVRPGRARGARQRRDAVSADALCALQAVYDPNDMFSKPYTVERAENMLGGSVPPLRSPPAQRPPPARKPPRKKLRV